MHKKTKREWVKTLRSNKFYQITYQLADDNRGRDVLGVLCYVKGTAPSIIKQHSTASEIANGILSGLSKRSERFLAEKNDTGWSFKKLAKYIDKNY